MYVYVSHLPLRFENIFYKNFACIGIDLFLSILNVFVVTEDETITFFNEMLCTKYLF